MIRDAAPEEAQEGSPSPEGGEAAAEARADEQADERAEAPASQVTPALHPEPAERLIYLGLLNMTSRESLDRCAHLVRTSTDPRRDGHLLLESSDWRSKLVGVCWLLFQGMDRTSRQLLWRAVDGSWVSLQAAAVAYLLDSQFRAEAEARLKAAQWAERPLSKGLAGLAGLYQRLPSGTSGPLLAWLRSPQALYLPEGQWARVFVVTWQQRLISMTPLQARGRWVRGKE